MREIMDVVLNAAKPPRFPVNPLRWLTLTLAVAALGCHAQSPLPAEAGAKLTPELARRVEVMIRSRSEVPPQYAIAISGRTKSEVPGFDSISVTFSAEGNTSRPLVFLLSTDGKTLAQFNKFDISQDPKNKVLAAGRPARGGPENAPVAIVVFDDLECPYCANLNAALFPALLDRYKDQVRVTYLDFPLSQHPWARRAAIDASCLAGESPAAYWNFVDAIHLSAADLGGAEHKLEAANAALDKTAMEKGADQKVNAAELTACVAKQDDAKLQASIKQAESLGVDATPALFINGEKVAGALPMEYIYRIIDDALTAAGQVPPPPVPIPPTVKPGT